MLLTPWENITEPSVGFTQHLVPAAVLSQEQSIIPFYATRHFQFRAYRLGGTYSKFLADPQIFLRVLHTCSMWTPWFNCAQKKPSPRLSQSLLSSLDASLFFSGYLVAWNRGSQHEGSYRYMYDSLSISLCRRQFNSLLSAGDSLDPFPRSIWNRCCGACTGTSSSVWRISQVFQASLHSLVCRHVRSCRPCHGEIVPSLI